MTHGPAPAALSALRDAVLAKTYVSLGSRRTASPHEFYRYPARFPPAFARAAIEAFSSPGDLVLDPFIGGGTTIVEARLLGRPAVGADLNPLAVFVSRVKARPLTAAPLEAVSAWADELPSELRRSAPARSLDFWEDEGYLRNVDDPEARSARAVLASALASLDRISDGRARDLARCVVLRAGQWALDMRSEVPGADELASMIPSLATDMASAARAYARQVRRADGLYELAPLTRRTRVVVQPVPGLAKRVEFRVRPALVVTSPPYPGVYVNYHRWKVRGRRETPAPFWLANELDGNGLAYYTMSARADRSLSTYFEKLAAAFSDVRSICGHRTVVVQMVGFHNPQHDLPRYLDAMYGAGFEEVRYDDAATDDDGRLWRSVPNRRWWAANAADMHTASEVVLFHRPRRPERLLADG